MRFVQLGKRWIICLMAAVALLVSACASSTPVTDAPLETSELRELRQTMIGTWEHTHIEDGGEREPMESTEVTYTFREDGTGVYHQVVKSVGMENENPFKWQLEGRNIRLDLEKGGKTTYFRAEKWESDEMKWFNYMMSDHYIVQKQQ